MIIKIGIERETRKVNIEKSSFMGIEGENLQGKIVFDIDEEIEGIGRVEYELPDGNKNYAMLTKEIIDEESGKEGYTIPIKSVITKFGKILMQLVITERDASSDDEEEQEIPIFKSKEFYLNVSQAINAEIEEPEGYTEWIDIANSKLNEIDIAIEEVDKALEDIGDINETIKGVFYDVSYNASTGVMSFSRRDEANKDIDLPLELIIESGYYDSDSKELVLVLANDDEIRIPVTDLVNEYYADEKTIELKNVDGKLTFNVKSGIYQEKEEGKGLSSNDFTDEYKSQVDSNTLNRHSHLNKDILDTIEIVFTSEDKENLNDNTLNRHNHANKEILDQIEEAFTTAYKEDLDNLSAVATSGSYNDLIDKPTIPEATVVVDNLTSTSATDALSANQGRVLNEKISDISGSIDNEINAIKADVESNTADISEINDRIDELENNVFDIGEASGSELYITDSINHDFLALSIDGKSEQETTEGYQLLPYPYEETTKTVNGITFTDNGDGTVTVNGTSTSTATFRLYGYSTNLKEIPGNYISGGTSDIFVRVVTYDNGQYHVLANSTGNADEIDKSTYQNGYIEIAISPNTTLNNQLIKPLLSNSADAVFEKYTGGQPSPNPEYPGEIENVTGLNNLLNLDFTDNSASQSYGGYTVTGDKEKQSFTINGGSEEANFNREFILKNPITVQPGDYILFFKPLSGTYSVEGTGQLRSISLRFQDRTSLIANGEQGNVNLIPTIFTIEEEKVITAVQVILYYPVTFDNFEFGLYFGKANNYKYIPYGRYLNIVSNGKNMFNIVDGSGTRAGVEVKLNGSSISFNGTSTGSGNLFPNTFNYVHIGKLKAGTYTFSSKIINGSVTGDDVSEAFHLRKSDNTSIFNFGLKNNSQFIYSFTLNEDDDLFVQYYINGAGLVYDNLIINVQLEKGSVATDFEAYKESDILIDMNKPNLADYSNIEKYNRDLSTAPTVGGNSSDDYYNVCSIGEVEDSLYVQFDESDKQYHAYLKKNIESVILDGTENWQGGADASTSGYKYFYCTKFTDVPVSYDIMCDKLNPYIDGALGSETAVTTSTVGLNLSESNNLRVIFDSSLLEDISTGTNALNSFKNWLSQNKPEVLYILANQYTIDLGPVNMLKTYKNTTNVSTNDNLEPTINASYYKDFKVSISDLISRVSALEETNSVSTISKVTDSVSMSYTSDATDNVSASETLDSDVINNILNS